MKLIDISDLVFWADKPASKAGLPELISRLVRATHTKIKDLNIPKGKSTFRGGWDGFIISADESEFVPKGYSAWEFGTQADYVGKAEGDYVKRTKDTLGADPSKTTLIMVTPRTWEKKDEWVTEKMKDNIWKDIIVYDGGKLVEWLALAPVQTLWFLQQIDRAPTEGFESITDFWEGYRYGPSFQISPEMVTVGRQDVIVELIKRIKLPPNIIPIRAQSISEMIAFLAGAIELMEIGDKEEFISRTVIVENLNAFKILVSNFDSLIFVPRFDSGSIVHQAVHTGHYVILPVDPDEDYPGMLDLPKLDRDGLIEALKRTGLSAEKAEKLSRESNRDMAVIRRRERFEMAKPTWADPANIMQIIPAALVGKWNEKIEGDQEVLEVLSGVPYAEYVKKINPWKMAPDTPLKQVADQWRITSPLDVWYYVRKHIQKDDLEKFMSCFHTVFNTADETLVWTVEEKIEKMLKGSTVAHSPAVRKGLAESLILIALSTEPLPSVPSGQAWVDGQLSTMLKADPQKLLKFGNHELPLVAEASPLVFLNWIEEYLANTGTTIYRIFEEKDAGLMPVTYLTGLLWCLEALAWFPEYLSRVVCILTELVALDPGGQLSNRPANSLRAIFLPWCPQTYAPESYRKDALSLVKKKSQEVAWKLCLSLLPKGQEVAFKSYQFRWRYSVSKDIIVPIKFSIASYDYLIEIALLLGGTDPERLAGLVKEFAKPLSEFQRNLIVDHIKTNIPIINDDENRLYKEIRTTIGQHEELSSAHWALSMEELKGLKEILAATAPVADVASRLWLFEEAYPKYPGMMSYRGHSIEERDNDLLEKRKEALIEILKDISLRELISHIPGRGNKGLIGETLAYILDKEADIKLMLETTELNLGNADYDPDLYMFFRRHSAIIGADKLMTLVLKLLPDNFSDQATAKTLTFLEFNNNLLDFVKTQNTKVQEKFWQTVSVYPGYLSPENKLYVLTQLTDYHRHYAALDTAFRIRDELSSELLYEILKNAVTKKSIDHGRIQNYEVNELFAVLDRFKDLSKEKFFELEWLYMPVLTSLDNKRRPVNLHREMMNNPLAFMEILIHVSIPRSETLKQQEFKLNDQDKEWYKFKVRQCYKLISTCNQVPGADEIGLINYSFFQDWIITTRKLAAEAERSEIADAFIGQILAKHPLDENGLPVKEIRDMIEAINTASLKSNFSASLFNDEGPIKKGVFEGGVDERIKADEYNQKRETLVNLWPSTSAIFQGLSDSYTYSALQADNQATLMDLDY
jgi:hypothetical protein